MDIITWPFVLAICSLVVCVLFVSSARIGLDSTPGEWVGILLVGSLGYLAVTASNILTTMLVLGFLDIVEFAILLFSQTEKNHMDSELRVFIWRISGLTIFLAAFGWQFSLTGLSGDWRVLQTGPVYLMLAACAIRIGLVPTILLRSSPRLSQNGLASISSLVGFLTVFAIIIQLPYHPFISIWKVIILIYLFVTAFSASIKSLRSPNSNDPIIDLQITAGSLIFASYILGFSSAGIALSISFVTLGTILLLEYPISIFSKVLGFLALIGFSGLPFTPNITGFLGFGLSRDFPGVIFIIPVTVFLFSSIRILFRKTTIENPLAERWTGILSPIGLVFPIITSWIVFLNSIPGQSLFQISIPAMLAVFICIALFVNIRFAIFDFYAMINKIFGFFPVLNPSYTLIIVGIRKTLITSIQVPVNIIRTLFEGDGGVLWSVLSLVLIITVIRTLGFTP
jgi:hypothetical protein